MIKTIIFDNGGVLVDDSWNLYRDAICEQLHVDLNELNPLFSAPLKKAEIGEITYKQFLDCVAEVTGLGEYNEILTADYKLNPTMTDWLIELGKNFHLILLTNDVGSFPLCDKKWKMEQFFGDSIYNSSKIKVAKPNIDAFKYVIEREILTPKEVLFIDDKQKNTDVAKSLGLQAIVFTSPEQCKNELQLLIEEDNDKK